MTRRLRLARASPGTPGSLESSLVALADQGLISAANFATLVLLARATAPPEFGAFVLAYTTLLLIGGLQSALVTQPHNVLGQSRGPSDYPTYTRSTAAGQLVFSLAVSSLSLAGAGVAAMVAPGAASILVALALAAFVWQLQEFARRVLYTEGRITTAFAADVVSYGGQVGVIAAIVAVDPASLTAVVALLVVAGTSALGGVPAGLAIRDSLRGSLEAAALRENWAFGKWLGAGMAASWLATQFWFYLAAAMLGATAAGALKAGQVILGPLTAFYLFLATVLPIRLAARRERGGDAAVRSDLRRAYVLTLGPVIVYCTLAAIFAERILSELYGSRYDTYGSVVVLFAAYYFVMHVAYLLTAALSASRLTKALFRANAAAGLVGLVAAWPLVATLEENGAVVGMILSAAVAIGLFGRAYRTAHADRSGAEFATVGTRA